MRVKQELNKKLNKMTCKECSHYNSINATEGRCDKMTYLGIVDVVNAEYKACKEYEDKEDSWESVSK